MRDANPIRTLGDYSKPSHEGYRNTIELLLELAKKRLPTRSNTTREDLTTLLAQSFPPEELQKLRNDFLIVPQQHHVDIFTEAWTHFIQGLSYKKCPEYIRPPPHQARESSPTLDGSSSCSKRYHTQVNKIHLPHVRSAVGPHTLSIELKDPEQAFFLNMHLAKPTRTEKYQSRMASQNARLSKFEADFKQQQSEMTNKIDLILKTITNRLAGSLPSDMVKNLKLSTSPILSARSYPTIDPQCSSHPSTSINAIKTCSTKVNISQISQLQTWMGIRTQQLEEPEPTLEDEFQDLHLNLPVLEVLTHALIYNAILDKYVESLELGKSGSTFVQGEVSAKMKDLGLFTLPCRLGDSKRFDTLADLGSCVNIIPLYLFKMLNI
ncbi:hypothetical protein Tco_0698366 [Tanacetum coccineum]